MSNPKPFYTAQNLHSAHQLRYGWTAWPQNKTALPLSPPDNFWTELSTAWEKDDLRPLERRWSRHEVQITFSAAPSVSPHFLASRAKGRLQHALRNIDSSVPFAANFAVRALGRNTRKVIDKYISEQIIRSDLADSRFAELLDQFAYRDCNLHLTEPAISGSGRYWYNLHIVLAVSERIRGGNPEILSALRDMALRVGRAKEIGIAEWSIMPDHMHALVRPPSGMSPEETVLAFQNNLAWAAGCRFWEDAYYVGTCGEYTMGAVRGV